MVYKVGLLVVATNKYIDFFPPLWESVKKHFLPGQEVTMFLFTNITGNAGIDPSIIRIYQQHMPWPGPALFRYNIFDSARQELEKMDYLFCCDADMLFVDTVGDEILGDLVGTRHPGFYKAPRTAFTYETNSASLAHVKPSEGITYFAQAFNGGSRQHYLKMCQVLSEKISDDYRRGIIAVWHDESHMNRYFIDNPPTLSLSPSYCYPESWSIPFKKRLLALDKNHKEMRT